MKAQLSREQLLADIEHAEEKAATLCGACAEDHTRLAGCMRMLLAGLDSEPYWWAIENRHGDARFIEDEHAKNDIWDEVHELNEKDDAGEYFDSDAPYTVVPVYRHAAPPAQVAYPEQLPCPVLLEPGIRFGKNVTTRLMLEALQRRADYYAELEAMTPEQRAEHDAGIAEFRAMLPAPVAKHINDPYADPDFDKPAPVVNAKASRELFEAWFAADCSFDKSPSASEDDNYAWKECNWYVWERCRAAMQSPEQEV